MAPLRAGFLTACRAALLCLLSVSAPQAAAQEIALTARDGTLTLSGRLLGFDGAFYRLDTIYGELTVDADRVTCAGTACPSRDPFVAEIALSGADTMARVLLPALVEGFALQSGLRATRDAQDAAQVVYTLSDPSGPVARLTIRGTSTDEGFADLLANEADIAMATREIRPVELDRMREAGLGALDAPGRARVLALDGLVGLVAPDNPVRALGLEEIAGLLTGEIGNWQALGGPDAPVVLHLPVAGSGAGQALADRLLAPDGPGVAPGATRHAVLDDIARAVARDPFAFGLSTHSEAGPARAVALRGACGFALRPARRTIKTEDYPLTQPLFLYQPARRLPALGRDFLAYATSAAAQGVIRRAGFVDQAPEEIPIDAQGNRLAHAIALAGRAAPLSEVQRLVEVLAPRVRLTTSFRFEPGASRLDAQSRANVAQLARALAAGRYDGRELLFVGFSDGVGASEANRVIAAERADSVLVAVRDAAPPGALERVVLGTEAFGEALPMACDDTEWGRSVNRRVEVWLR